MKISKMDHAMLSFGLLGLMLVPRSRIPGGGRSPAKPVPPRRPR